MTAPAAEAARRPEDRPDFLHPDYVKQQEDWQTTNDLLRGWRAVKAAGDRYIVPLPGEEPEDREQRIGRAHPINAFEDTIKALSGIMLRRAPTLEGANVPVKLKEHIEDIDGAGNHLAVFAMQLARSGIAKGHAAFLVDYPQVRDPDAITIEDEKRLRLRPYWVHVPAENIINWDTERIGGEEVLTLLVLREAHRKRVGLFGHAVQERFRVFRRFVLSDETVRISVQIYEKSEGARGGWLALPPTFYGNVDRIPLVIFYAGEQEGFACTRPPLLSLAEQNIDYMNVLLDHRHAMHIASAPVPFFRLIEKPPGDGAIVMGPTRGLIGNDPQSDARWLETTGSSCTQTRDELKDIRVLFAQLGVSMLSPETRAAETAEGKRLDKSDKDSRLAIMARRMKDALEIGIELHAKYMKIAAPGITVNLKLDGLTLSPELIDRWLALYRERAITRDTLWLALAEGGLLPEDFDADKEAAELDKPSGDVLPGDGDDGDGEPAGAGDGEGGEGEPGVPPKGVMPPALAGAAAAAAAA